MQRFALSTTLLSLALLTACNAADSTTAISAQAAEAPATQVAAETIGPFSVATIARFDEPWAFSFLPDGRVLVSEKPGRLKLVDVAGGRVGEVTGV
ncbi:MAG: PQQ-dependent sugar dehydrogenase, partial [Luteimonas sp.]|nr:PQQ-dependent sugar dehydrogenase [Luteimonas sp.]